jgi:myo-inositol-1(or 4)-monophosphatase
VGASLDRAADIAVRAARRGGEVLLSHFGRLTDIQLKGEADLVTEADVAAERAIVELIRAEFPTHRVFAEEGSVGGDDPAHRWIIDPLDGTTNYAHGMPLFTVSVAYERDGEVAAGAVFQPATGELFHARTGGGAWLGDQPIRVSRATELRHALLTTGFPSRRDMLEPAMAQFAALNAQTHAVRRTGSAALDLAWVATGRFDGYWERTISAWDVAAGVVIAREAGASITDLAGRPFLVDAGNILTTAPGIHAELLSALTRVCPSPTA